MRYMFTSPNIRLPLLLLRLRLTDTRDRALRGCGRGKFYLYCIAVHLALWLTYKRYVLSHPSSASCSPAHACARHEIRISHARELRCKIVG